MSFSAISEKTADIKNIFSEIYSACAIDSYSNCAGLMHGTDGSKKMIYNLLKVMKVNKSFVESYVEAYGENAFNKFNDAFKLKVSIIHFEDFSLVSNDDIEAVFKDTEGHLVTLEKINDRWVMNLNKSYSSILGDPTVEEMNTFISLLLGNKSKLIRLINEGTNVDDVYKFGGRFYAATIYGLLDADGKSRLDKKFDELGIKLAAVREEILREYNEKVIH